MNNKIIQAIQEVHEQWKGGAGSGNFGHSGRPGKLGGSSGGGGGSAGGGSGAVNLEMADINKLEKSALYYGAIDTRYIRGDTLRGKARFIAYFPGGDDYDEASVRSLAPSLAKNMSGQLSENVKVKNPVYTKLNPKFATIPGAMSQLEFTIDEA